MQDSFIAAHLESRDVARVIYGAVIGLALVVALEDHPPEASAAVAALIATAVAVGLAEVYSEVIGEAAQTHGGLHLDRARKALGDAAAVIVGASFPALFFIAAAADWIELDTAFTLAKWTGFGLICGYGYLAARLAGTSRASALFQALAVGLIGATLIGLKALLH